MSTSTLTKKKTAPAKVGTVLTEHEYSTLQKMLASKDPEDHTMAQAILNQCDVPKSIYWIWKLARNYSSQMVYMRTKASREFSRESGLFEIAWMKATFFALRLIKKGQLTPEIYQHLKPEILDELASRNSANNFYDMHITIKDEYKEFDPDHILTKL